MEDFISIGNVLRFGEVVGFGIWICLLERMIQT